MKLYTKDFGLWLFATIALACLVVSTPATFTLVSIFHNDGSAYAFYATIAVVCILEAGAVASKIATLFVPDAKRALIAFCIAALAVNALSNLIYAVQVAGSKLNGYTLWIGAIVYAAFVPVLLYLMLHQLVKRVQHLRCDATDVQLQVQRTMQPVQQTVEQFAYLMQAMHTVQMQMQINAPDVAPLQIADAQLHLDAPLHCIKCNAVLVVPDGKDSGRYRSATARYGCAACKAG